MNKYQLEKKEESRDYGNTWKTITYSKTSLGDSTDCDLTSCRYYTKMGDKHITLRNNTFPLWYGIAKVIDVSTFKLEIEQPWSDNTWNFETNTGFGFGPLEVNGSQVYVSNLPYPYTGAGSITVDTFMPWLEDKDEILLVYKQDLKRNKTDEEFQVTGETLMGYGEQWSFVGMDNNHYYWKHFIFVPDENDCSYEWKDAGEDLYVTPNYEFFGIYGDESGVEQIDWLYNDNDSYILLHNNHKEVRVIAKYEGLPEGFLIGQVQHNANAMLGLNFGCEHYSNYELYDPSYDGKKRTYKFDFFERRQGLGVFAIGEYELNSASQLCNRMEVRQWPCGFDLAPLSSQNLYINKLYMMEQFSGTRSGYRYYAEKPYSPFTFPGTNISGLIENHPFYEENGRVLLKGFDYIYIFDKYLGFNEKLEFEGFITPVPVSYEIENDIMYVTFHVFSRTDENQNQRYTRMGTAEFTLKNTYYKENSWITTKDNALMIGHYQTSIDLDFVVDIGDNENSGTTLTSSMARNHYFRPFDFVGDNHDCLVYNPNFDGYWTDRTNLEKVTITKRCTDLGYGTFYAHPENDTQHFNFLYEIEFEEGSSINGIPGRFAAYASYLSTIKIPETVTVISSDAFMYTNLSEFTIPKNVTTIGVDVFLGLLSDSFTLYVESEILDDKVLDILEDTNIEAIYVPASVYDKYYNKQFSKYKEYLRVL